MKTHHEPIEKSNILDQLITGLAFLQFTKEKMPELIPVRVITKVHPLHQTEVNK
jgi:hypothetical protein